MKNRVLNNLISKSISFVILMFAATVIGVYAQPANDSFANAEMLSGIRVSVVRNNVDATKEAGEPQHGFNVGGKSVWFKWTAPMSRTMAFSTSRTGQNLNTLISVYYGTALNSLVSYAGNDNIAQGNVRSRGNFNVLAGHTYYIAVDGASIGGTAVSGSFRLDIQPMFPIQASDTDGDGMTDLTVFRPSTGDWYSNGSTKQMIRHFGTAGDIPVVLPRTAFNGDTTVFRPSTGTWYAQYGCCQGDIVPWGTTGDIPAPESFGVGGYLNYAVFRPSTGTWYAKVREGDGLPEIIVQFGQAGDIPVPGHYSPDWFADMAVFRPSTGVWYILERSTFAEDNHIRIVQFGLPGDKPVQGDYDGDGLIDPAIYRPSTGTWWVLRSSDNQQHAFRFGTAEDVPSTGDYDGDGIFDFAVFRPSTGTWYIRNSETLNVRIEQWGTSGDIPMTANRAY